MYYSVKIVFRREFDKFTYRNPYDDFQRSVREMLSEKLMLQEGDTLDIQFIIASRAKYEVRSRADVIVEIFGGGSLALGPTAHTRSVLIEIKQSVAAKVGVDDDDVHVLFIPVPSAYMA